MPPYMVEYDNSGAHRHMLLRAQGATASDGIHAHIWWSPEPWGFLPERSALMTYYDGAHVHALPEATALRTGQGGSHIHGVPLEVWTDNGRRSKVLVTAEDGAHSHELLARKTADDGIHAHQLTIDGIARLSIMPSDIVALLDAEEINRSAENEVSLTGLDVFIGGTEYVCRHVSREEAQKCHDIRQVLKSAGFPRLHTPNVHGLLELTSAAAVAALAKPATAGVGGRLIAAMERLAAQR